MVRPTLAFLASIVALAPACAPGRDGEYFGTTERRGKDPHTFYVNNGSEPEYLDPGKSHDSASSILVHQMFEGLTAYHPEDLRPTAAMAVRYDKSDDNRFFRFYLRENGKWSDGKPVTAHDFEYAWKRVLRPATASLAAPNLYALKNGEAFNLGKLKVARTDLALLAEPHAGAPERLTVPKGGALRILGRSPMKVATAVVPLKEIPATKLVTLSKADARKKTPEQLSFGAGAAAVEAAADGGWKDAEVTVVSAGPAVDCNDAADRWFLVSRGAERGWLPGCALSAPKQALDAWLLVTPHSSMPTYVPGPLADQQPKNSSPDQMGFVRASDAIEDDSVVGVRAVGDHVLEVELERPTPYFLDLTSTVTLAPVRRDVIEAFEARGEPDLWVRPEHIVSNGPYVLDEHKFRYEITMKRNPHYWDKDRLKIHRIVFLEIEEHNATMNLYKGGDMDYIGNNSSLPSEYMQLLETKKDFQRFSYLSTYWYEFNVKKPPVDDVRVRRALNLAVDKKMLVEKITRAGQTPATHYVPDFTGLGYSDQVAADRAAGTDPFDTPETRFNPERARELLREAGYDVQPDGDGFKVTNFPPLEILYNTSEGHKQIAVAIQDMWKRHLGVSATLRNEEWKVMLKNVRDGHFQVVRFGWVGDYNHPHTWLDTFLSYSPQNRTGWADTEYDELLRKAAATPDQKESIKLYRQAEKRAVDGMAKMPLYFYTKSTLVKPWVKGFVGNPRNVHLVKWFWIDPDWRNNPSNDFAYPLEDLPPPGRISP